MRAQHPIDAETAFQRWINPGPGVKHYPRAYTDWCALERVRTGWQEPDGHVRAWREMQRREGK